MKLTELSRRVGRIFTALYLFVAVLSLGALPASAAQVVEEHGTVYGDMVGVEQVCSFLTSPALSSLADLLSLDLKIYQQSLRELSAPLNLWLVTKTKAVGLDDTYAVYLSDETSDELKNRFSICYGLHSNDQQFLKVLRVVFNNSGYPPSLDFVRPYFGQSTINLEAIVFMASMKDGNEYLNRYLQGTAGLLASRVTIARKKQAAQQAAPSTANNKGEDGPEDDDGMDSVLGGPAAYARYSCEMTGAAVFGVPNFNGADKSVTTEISVQADGTAILNGKVVHPAGTIPAPSGSDLPFSAVLYKALDVKHALFSTEGRGPGLLNPSQDELQAFEQLKGFVEGTTDSLLAGRQRYLAISLAKDLVILGDVTAGGELVNRNTPACARTR